MDKKYKHLTTIVNALEENLARIQYGETTVCLKVHAGRVVSVRYSLTESVLNAVPNGEKEGKYANSSIGIH